MSIIKERPFPQPTKFAPKCTRWRLSDIELWEYGKTRIESEDERWLSAAQLSERFGVTKVCIWNWTQQGKPKAA